MSATHISFLDVREQSDNQVRRATRLSLVSMVYAVSAMAALIIIAPWVPKIPTSDFAATAGILKWLTPLVILRGTGAFPMNGLLGLGRNDLRTRLLVGNAVLSVVLYVALIPTYSWKGARGAGPPALGLQARHAAGSWRHPPAEGPSLLD